MTEQLTSLSITGASGSIYRLDKFLGGGQTAVVYQGQVTHCPTNLQRVGQACAVKLMVPGLDIATARRFGEEENILIELRSRLQQIDLKTLAPKYGDVEPLPIRAEQLIPEVWDQGEDLGRAFLVMTVAQGDPLDDLLRRGTFSQQKRESEHSTLWLIYQLLAVFQALHEGLHRSYLDFQPRNVFWQHKAGVITVIDWNLLSPVEPQPGAPIFVHDCQVIARLLYRLLVGVELSGNSPMQMVSPPGWQVLTRSTQLLLREILAPDTLASISSRVLFTRIERELKKRTELADVLLLQAAERLDLVGLKEKTDADKLAQSKEKTTESQRLLTLSQMQGMDEAEALLELAQLRGNARMENIKEKVQRTLEHNRNRLSYIAQAQSFLRAGDFALARQFFADAIKEATQPASQLTAWRWWTLAKQLPTGAHLEETLQALDKILETTAEQPALGVETRNRLRSLPWPGVEVVADEMEQVERLQDLLTLGEADPVQRQKSETGEGKDASGTAGSIQERLKDAYEASNKALDALNALNNIRLPGKENSYADAIWLYLARASGLNNIADVQAAVEKKRQKLRDRVKQLDYLEQISGQLTITKALDLLDGRDPQIDCYDPELHRRVLAHTPDWFDGKDNEYSAYDAGLDRLLRTLTVLAPTRQDAIALYQRQLSLLQTAEYWVRQPVPVLMPEDANTNEVDSAAMPVIQPRQLMSLDYSLTLLQEIARTFVHAPKRRQEQVESLVNSCIQSRYTTALINTWLADVYPREFKFLEDGLNYQRAVAEERRTLKNLQNQVEQAEQQLTALDQQEGFQRQRAEQVAKETKEALAQEAAQLRADHERKFVHEVQKREERLQSLKEKEQRLSTEIAKLEAVFAEETKKRQKLLDQNIVQRRQDLETLETQFKLRKHDLEADLANLDSKLSQYRNECTKMDGYKDELQRTITQQGIDQQRLRDQINTYNSQKQQLVAELSDLQASINQAKLILKKFVDEPAPKSHNADWSTRQGNQNQPTSDYPRSYEMPSFDRKAPFNRRNISNNLDSAITDQITVLLGLAIGVQGGTGLESRISDELKNKADEFERRFSDAYKFEQAQPFFEEIAHIYRVVTYLPDSTESQGDSKSQISQNREYIEEVYKRISKKFRQRWVKD